MASNCPVGPAPSRFIGVSDSGWGLDLSRDAYHYPYNTCGGLHPSPFLALTKRPQTTAPQLGPGAQTEDSLEVGERVGIWLRPVWGWGGTGGLRVRWLQEVCCGCNTDGLTVGVDVERCPPKPSGVLTKA